MADTFDRMLLQDATLSRRGSGTDEYNLPNGAFSALAVVKGRFTTKGAGREFKQDKETTVSAGIVFIRPYPGLTHKDRVTIGGVEYNILSLDNPSNLDHHYELHVELVEP